MLKLSLNQRIIFSAIIVLFFFVALTAVALNKAYKSSTKEALKNTLNSQLFALIATAEVDIINKQPAFIMPSSDLDTLLGLPSSGLYAQVINQQGQFIWQSDSSIGAQLPTPSFLQSGDKKLHSIKHLKSKLYQYSYGVNWIVDDVNFPITFIISNDLTQYDQQISNYRDTLWFWLGGMAIFLIISQVFILRWGLQPIRQVVSELKNIESGAQQNIEQSYPKEIEFLSVNINHLLAKELQQKQRYRNALGDLAHSLKTPLAIMQSTASGSKNNEINEQIQRMNNIVEYQLQRASTAGSNNLAQQIEISSLIQRIIDSLQKVNHDKTISCHIDAVEMLHFKADEGDMMELLGNLIDNAFKWAKSHIEIKAHIESDCLIICVSDDGVGFPESLIEELKQRGQRADQTTPGHGIGLSIVSNIVDSYNGQLIISNRSPHGAQVTLTLF